MDKRYAAYLLILVCTAAAAALAAAWLLFGIKRRNAAAHDDGRSQKPVSCGNVSIFFDKQGNAVLIPYVADKFKSGKATSDIIELHKHYKPLELGKKIRLALASCRSSKPADSTALMDRLGSRNWREFSEGKLSISVYYSDGKGILFNSTVRTPEGAFIFSTRGAEVTLPPDACDEELGRTVLGLLQRCR